MLSHTRKVGVLSMVTGVALLYIVLFAGNTVHRIVPVKEVSSIQEQVQQYVVDDVAVRTPLNAQTLRSAEKVVSVGTPASKNTTEASVMEVDRYEIPVYTYSTVLSAMEAYQEVSNFLFSGRTFQGLGFFVDTIGGKKAQKGKYWFLYVNEVRTDKGASSQFVSPQDVVEWRYESGR